MCLTALALGGAAIGGVASLIGSNSATNAQQDAAQQQLALQEQIYGDSRALFDPY